MLIQKKISTKRISIKLDVNMNKGIKQDHNCEGILINKQE